MKTKPDNHNLNLLLTVVIAVLILFLVFKDQINLGSYYNEQGVPQSDDPYSRTSAIQEKLKKFNSMEEQLELEKVERIENAFLSNKTVARLKKETARLTSALAQTTAKANLSIEETQQEKLLSEQLIMQLKSERLNTQTLMEQRAIAEKTIEALNIALEQEQKYTLIMRRDKEKTSLDKNTIEAKLQLKKKELVRGKQEVNRLTEELAKRDHIIASKNGELARKKSELLRLKQQFVKTGARSTGS